MVVINYLIAYDILNISISFHYAWSMQWYFCEILIRLTNKIYVYHEPLTFLIAIWYSIHLHFCTVYFKDIQKGVQPKPATLKRVRKAKLIKCPGSRKVASWIIYLHTEHFLWAFWGIAIAKKQSSGPHRVPQGIRKPDILQSKQYHSPVA